MTKSTITVKNQTTVPRETREKLLVSAASPAFLRGEGRIKVGPGDSVEDVRKARKLLGLKEQ